MKQSVMVPGQPASSGKGRGPLILRMKLIQAIALLGLPAIGLGQWVHYPTAGVPRKTDGAPNLYAPAPRLTNGKPDFSGIWHTAKIISCDAELSWFIDCRSEIGGSPLARNLGIDLPEGLPYQPWAAALVKQRSADRGVDDPHVRCLPDNPPRTWVMPHLTKAVHTPKLLVLLYEVNAMYRQIFTDGRPLPQDPNPAWNGYSTAQWEGDTLAVHTAGFRNDLWADMSGSPLSEAATLIERIRRPNYGTLELQITVDDPKVYTKPWTVRMTQKLELDTELVDEICLENERSYQRMQSVRLREASAAAGRRAEILCSCYVRPAMPSLVRLKARPANRFTKSWMESRATAESISSSCTTTPTIPR